MPSSAPQSPTGDVAAMTYETARANLVHVVQTLEAGAETLDQSLALWERGEALADRCQQLLDGARARLEAVRPPAPSAAADGVAHPGGEASA